MTEAVPNSRLGRLQAAIDAHHTAASAPVPEPAQAVHDPPAVPANAAVAADVSSPASQLGQSQIAHAEPEAAPKPNTVPNPQPAVHVNRRELSSRDEDD